MGRAVGCATVGVGRKEWWAYPGGKSRSERTKCPGVGCGGVGFKGKGAGERFGQGEGGEQWRKVEPLSVEQASASLLPRFLRVSL